MIRKIRLNELIHPGVSWKPRMVSSYIIPFCNFHIKGKTPSLILEQCLLFLMSKSNVNFAVDENFCVQVQIFELEGTEESKAELTLFSGVNSTVVEFRRIYGDSILFRSVYNELEEFVNEKKAVKTERKKIIWPELESPIVDIELNHVFDLAQSVYIDVREQGICLLFSLGNNNPSFDTARLIQHPSFVQTCQTAIRSGGKEARLIFTLLCKLRYMLNSICVSCFLKEALDIVQQPETLENTETQYLALMFIQQHGSGQWICENEEVFNSIVHKKTKRGQKEITKILEREKKIITR